MQPPPLTVVLALSVFEAFLVFAHAVVYATAAAAFGIGGTAVVIVLILLAFSFLCASLLVHRFSNPIIDALYAAASYWFGLVAFLLGASMIFLVAAWALYSRNYYIPPARIAAPAFAAFFLLHLYGTWRSGRVGITRVAIELPNLPAAWRGKKVVFVSDPHLGAIRAKAFAQKIVRKIQALAPEAVFIGGDLYDGVACDADAIIAPLAELAPPRGIYFITGNHEYYGDTAAFLAAIRTLGNVRVLNNEKIDLGGIQLVGVDDRTARKREDLARILEGLRLDRSAPSILLRHQPDELAAAERAGISLMLSGHTHRGQIFPLSYVTRRIYGGFDYGLRRLGAMQVYTSSGAGTWGPPLRLGTKSEIVCIELASIT